MDHKERNKQTRKQRQLNRIAEIRRLHKSLKMWQAIAHKQAYDINKIWDEKTELQKRIQKMEENVVPIWVKAFWK